LTHNIAILLHFIATREGEPAYICNHPMLCEVMPAAVKIGLVKHIENQRVALDQFWLLLTDRGWEAVREGLEAMNEVA
jgi:hypothetical protein